MFCGDNIFFQFILLLLATPDIEQLPRLKQIWVVDYAMTDNDG